MGQIAKPYKTIGRAEVISFPEQGIETVHARIDTGARTSAIWVSYAEVKNDKLSVIFFGPGHPLFTGKEHYFDAYTQDIVISSNGHQDLRFKIKLLVVLEGRRIRASFTLADRSTQVYPVLIGRNVLRGKFMVDVKTGKTLIKEENELLRKKRAKLSERGQL